MSILTKLLNENKSVDIMLLKIDRLQYLGGLHCNLKD